jgi:hypothetical protein
MIDEQRLRMGAIDAVVAIGTRKVGESSRLHAMVLKE